MSYAQQFGEWLREVMETGEPQKCTYCNEEFKPHNIMVTWNGNRYHDYCVSMAKDGEPYR